MWIQCTRDHLVGLCYGLAGGYLLVNLQQRLKSGYIQVDGRGSAKRWAVSQLRVKFALQAVAIRAMLFHIEIGQVAYAGSATGNTMMDATTLLSALAPTLVQVVGVIWPIVHDLSFRKHHIQFEEATLYMSGFLWLLKLMSSDSPTFSVLSIFLQSVLVLVHKESWTGAVTAIAALATARVLIKLSATTLALRPWLGVILPHLCFVLSMAAVQIMYSRLGKREETLYYRVTGSDSPNSLCGSKSAYSGAASGTATPPTAATPRSKLSRTSSFNSMKEGASADFQDTQGGGVSRSSGAMKEMEEQQRTSERMIPDTKDKHGTSSNKLLSSFNSRLHTSTVHSSDAGGSYRVSSATGSMTGSSKRSRSDRESFQRSYARGDYLGERRALFMVYLAIMGITTAVSLVNAVAMDAGTVSISGAAASTVASIVVSAASLAAATAQVKRGLHDWRRFTGNVVLFTIWVGLAGALGYEGPEAHSIGEVVAFSVLASVLTIFQADRYWTTTLGKTLGTSGAFGGMCYGWQLRGWQNMWSCMALFQMQVVLVTAVILVKIFSPTLYKLASAPYQRADLKKWQRQQMVTKATDTHLRNHPYSNSRPNIPCPVPEVDEDQLSVSEDGTDPKPRSKPFRIPASWTASKTSINFSSYHDSSIWVATPQQWEDRLNERVGDTIALLRYKLREWQARASYTEWMAALLVIRSIVNFVTLSSSSQGLGSFAHFFSLSMTCTFVAVLPLSMYGIWLSIHWLAPGWSKLHTLWLDLWMLHGPGMLQGLLGAHWLAHGITHRDFLLDSFLEGATSHSILVSVAAVISRSASLLLHDIITARRQGWWSLVLSNTRQILLGLLLYTAAVLLFRGLKVKEEVEATLKFFSWQGFRTKFKLGHIHVLLKMLQVLGVLCLCLWLNNELWMRMVNILLTRSFWDGTNAITAWNFGLRQWPLFMHFQGTAEIGAMLGEGVILKGLAIMAFAVLLPYFQQFSASNVELRQLAWYNEKHAQLMSTNLNILAGTLSLQDAMSDLEEATAEVYEDCSVLILIVENGQTMLYTLHHNSEMKLVDEGSWQAFGSVAPLLVATGELHISSFHTQLTAAARVSRLGDWLNCKWCKKAWNSDGDQSQQNIKGVREHVGKAIKAMFGSQTWVVCPLAFSTNGPGMLLVLNHEAELMSQYFLRLTQDLSVQVSQLFQLHRAMQEVERTNTLLQDILPSNVAEHLKQKLASMALTRGRGSQSTSLSLAGSSLLAMGSSSTNTGSTEINAISHEIPQAGTAQEFGEHSVSTPVFIPELPRLNSIHDDTMDVLYKQNHGVVSVLFADIVGYTMMSQALRPEQVMGMLHTLFSKYDHLCSDYDAYKVETIGDCYMACTGLINESSKHAEQLVNLGKAMIEAASSTLTPLGTPVVIRVGIHSGPVMSGVVGLVRARYCLFGDTVNTASRMESTGLPGMMQVSECTYSLLEETQHEFSQRSLIYVKGKGDMYTYLWPASLPAQLDEEGAGWQPESSPEEMLNTSIPNMSEITECLDSIGCFGTS